MQHTITSSLGRVVVSLGIAGAILLSSFAFATARDDDPTAYLYEGTCATLEDARMIDDIDDLEDDDLDEVWKYIGNDQDMPEGLLAEDGDIDRITDIEMLLDGEYAVVVHEVEDHRSNVLVCGDIEGELDENGELLFELHEVDDSGWEGRVFLHVKVERDDPDEVKFEVGIYPAGSVEPLTSATPTA